MAGSLVVAIYDFRKESEDDLAFSKGDFIKVTEEISSEWLRGIHNGSTGQFPSVFARKVLEICPARIGVAQSHYSSQEPDDLDFDKGQLIVIEEDVDDNWRKGHYDDKSGIFPKQFVTEVRFSAAAKQPNGTATHAHAPPPSGKANSDFAAQSPEELSFTKGATVLLEREVDGFWVTGEVDGKHGKFPGMFVDVFVPLPEELRYHSDEESSPNVNLEPTAKALFMYVGPTDKDLSFDKGDIIVLKKRVGKDWFLGEIGKHQGIFPQNYVEVIKGLPFDPNDVEDTPIEPSKKLVLNGNANHPSEEVAHGDNDRKSGLTANEKPPLQQKPRSLHLKRSLKKKKAPSSIAMPSSPPEASAKGAAVLSPTSDRVPLIVGTSPTSSSSKSNFSVIKPPPRRKRQAPQRPAATPIVTSSEKVNADLLDSVDRTSSVKLLKPLAPRKDARERLGSLSKSASSQSIQRVSLDHTVVTSSPSTGAAGAGCSSPGLRRHNTLPVHKCKPSPRAGAVQLKQVTSPAKNGASPTSPQPPNAAVSLDGKISVAMSQIEHQNELLSGVLSLFGLVDDETKRMELATKRDAYVATIDRLQDELSALEHERSVMLTQGSSADDIVVRIADIESQIEMHLSNRSSLQKMLTEAADPKERKELQDNIGFCLVMIESLNDELKELNDVLEEKKCPTMKAHPDGQAKMLGNRLKVIKELLNTERNYVNDLRLCTTNIYTYLKQSKVNEINVDVIFGILPTLCSVAGDFLDAMCATLTDMEHPNVQALASLFVDSLPKIKHRYAEYCRNYDDAQAWLERYEDQTDVVEELANAVDTVRNETQCWDLSSFLIKPVQRILKYPLILQEVFKNTPVDYPERDRLREAVSLTSDIAREINELKRRKDLVQKYQRPEGIGNKIQKLNWHSVRKKSSRINQKITRFTGLSHTIDEAFNEEERRLRNLERTVKVSLKNAVMFVECVQEQCALQKNVAEDIREFYMDQANSEEVDAYHYVFLKLCEVSALQFMDHVQSRFVDPLTQLLGLLQSPFRLIQKRHDKLLDFDYHLKRAEKIRDKDKIGMAKEELVWARNNYEAMNSQLLEDLPPLVERGTRLIRRCLVQVVKGHRAYLQQAYDLMQPLMKLGIMSPGREDIIGRSGAMLQVMSEELALLAFLPDAKEPKKSVTGSPYMKTNFYVDHHSILDSNHQSDPTSPMKPHARWSEDRPDDNELSPKSSPSSPTSTTTELVSPPQTDVDDLYEVVYDFEAADEHEVSAEQGAMVRVVSRADKKGNGDWWLVALDGRSGYIPRAYLDLPSPDHDADSRSVDSLASSRSGDPTDDGDYRIVEYDFEADNPGEIQLNEADIVKVITRSDLQGNGEWWLVELDGHQGYVPASYLASIDELASV